MRDSLKQFYWDRPLMTPLILCFVSAVLMVLSFPRFNCWGFAWIGLVPFFLALYQRKAIASFWIGYFYGLLFFFGTLYWFVFMAQSARIPQSLSFVAMFSLVCYLSLYTAFWAMIQSFFKRRSMLLRIIVAASLWVATEFLRDRLFSGFGWVMMGHTQYLFVPLIQVADITGVFGISFLVVMVNYLVYEFVLLWLRKKSRMPVLKPACLAFVLLGLTFFYSLMAKKYFYNYDQLSTTIGIVQGNIPQEQKWDKESQRTIIDTYKSLTKELMEKKPDFIIWPEAAFPVRLWEKPHALDEIRYFTSAIDRPLLLGLLDEENGHYYNSVYLISRYGLVLKKHRKMHLVPFGEYLPLREEIPILSEMVPIADFSAGETFTKFPLKVGTLSHQQQKGFLSVLICFEDTVSSLSRRMVLEGAELLVNMTNDAWFLDSKAPFLHLQAAVFQAVQNRRYLVRVANTGVSCFIDHFGRIYGYVEDQLERKTCISGTAVEKVVLHQERTFYTKFGDVFAYFCFGCILISSIICIFKKPTFIILREEEKELDR